jgi:hypothetical protein
VLAALACATPLAASAQTALADDDRAGLISAGVMAGAQLDMPDNWLLFGADARLQIAHALEISPRVAYHPLDNGHVLQLDANLLKNFDLARPGRFRPFMGVGGALRMYSPERGNGETKLGINLLSGLRIAMNSGAGYEPFITTQYTIMQDQLNVFSALVGVSFRLRN